MDKKNNSGIDNSGNRNSGNWNSGNRNSGNSNSGDRNSGNRNSGNWNSGNWNSGNWNSGDRNSGNWNSGNWNSGDRNSGNWNSGNRNSGDSNSGYRNSGDSNSGYRNSGCYNSTKYSSGVFNNKEAKILMFNKQSDWTLEDFYNSKAWNSLCKMSLTEWVSESQMNDEEKKKHPQFYVTGGYLKTLEYKEACNKMWNSLNKDEKQAILDLPNFDTEVFFDITGINVVEEIKPVIVELTLEQISKKLGIPVEQLRIKD